MQGMLFSLYWLAATLDCLQRLLWTIVHILYGIFFFISTCWRIEMVVPIVPGEREKVFSLSKPVDLADVKTIQRAFSGNKPGPSQRGLLGHVTVGVGKTVVR